MSALGIITTTLASAVADAATVAVSYPTGTTQASLTGSTGGSLAINDGAGGSFDQGAGGFTASFGGSTITITNDSGVTWPAGATLTASFGERSRNGSYNFPISQPSADIAAPTGGSTVDAEARTAIGSILGALDKAAITL